MSEPLPAVPCARSGCRRVAAYRAEVSGMKVYKCAAGHLTERVLSHYRRSLDEQPYHGTPPYVKGSDTSHAAALAAVGGVGSKRRVIHDLLLRRNATDDELERRTGWRHQTVSARRRELVLLKLVRDSGERRRTSSGRLAVVWEAT